MLFNNILNLFYPKLCGACSSIIINCADELCLNCEIHLVYESGPNTTKIKKALRGRVEIEDGVFFYLELDEAIRLLYSVRKKISNNILFHDIFRCKNKIYNILNKGTEIVRGNFTMKNAGYLFSGRIYKEIRCYIFRNYRCAHSYFYIQRNLKLGDLIKQT